MAERGCYKENSKAMALDMAFLVIAIMEALILFDNKPALGHSLFFLTLPAFTLSIYMMMRPFMCRISIKKITFYCTLAGIVLVSQSALTTLALFTTSEEDMRKIKANFFYFYVGCFAILSVSYLLITSAIFFLAYSGLLKIGDVMEKRR